MSTAVSNATNASPSSNSSSTNSKECLEGIDVTNELNFEGSKEDIRVKVLKIKNNSDREIAFKLKRTSPDIIQAYPGYGYITPNNIQIVHITLLAIAENRTQPISRERITVIVKGTPKNRPPDAKDLWLKRYKKTPMRFVVPIKIEGFEGFSGKKKEKKKKKSSKPAEDESEKSEQKTEA